MSPEILSCLVILAKAVMICTSNSRMGLDDEGEESEAGKEEEFQSVESHPSLVLKLIKPNLPNSDSNLWLYLDSRTPSQNQDQSTLTSAKSSPANQLTESVETFLSPKTTDFATIMQTIHLNKIKS